MAALVELRAQHHRLSALPASIGALGRLRELLLSGNALAHWSWPDRVVGRSVAAPYPGPMTRMRIVVGAALLSGGRVLAARRSAPADLAGRWEFPGGKVEPGESPQQALERELHEELGVRARSGRRLPGRSLVRADLELQIWTAELLGGEPSPLQDHSELRWLAARELETVDWLPQDRFALPAVAAELAGREGLGES